MIATTTSRHAAVAPRRGVAALTVLLLTLGMLGGAWMPTAQAAATLTATGTTITSVRANTDGALTGLQITGADPADSLSATLATDVGTVAIGTTTGLTLGYGNAWTGTPSVTFQGNQADIDAALTTAMLSAGDAAGRTAHVQLSVTPAVPGYEYLPATHHFYELVRPGNLTWDSADAAAKGRSFQGLPGYLATIPSATVNDFVSTKIENATNIWFGARAYQSDATDGTQSLAVENGTTYGRVWRWAAGAGESPIAGSVITLCTRVLYACSPAPGSNYAGWVGSEPNNYGYPGCGYRYAYSWWGGYYSYYYCPTAYTDGESAGVTNWSGGIGNWNDLPQRRDVGVGAYLVEYGDSSANGGFTSVASATSDVLITDVPRAPLLSATPDDQQAHLSFPTPESPNLAITGYEVSTNGGTTWAALTTAGASPVTADITGLTNGTTYSVSVRAVNDLGAGAASEPVAVKPRGLPFAPVVSGRGGDRAIALSFPPAADNGATVSGYEVSVDAGAWSALPTSGTTRLASTLRDLVNGTTYAVRVRALNLVGAGTASSSIDLTPASVPGAPVVTATPGDRSIALSFSPPADNGFAISGYQASTDSGGTWSDLPVSGQDVLAGTLTGLHGGTTYGVSVRAVNFDGNGAASTVASVTPYAVPDAPTLTAVAGDSSIGLSITPSADNGAVITGYQVSLDGGSTWASLDTSGASPLTATVTGLVNGTSYDVAVRAVTVPADGVASGTQTVTPAAVPSAPADLAVVPQDGQLALSLTPAAGNGAAVTGYQVSLDGGLTWNALDLSASEGSSSLTGLLTGLTNGTSYPVQVRALNLMGEGAATEPVSATPFGVPGAPVVTLTAGSQSIGITFAQPASNGSPITGYEASTDGGSTWQSLTTAGDQDRTATLDGLTNGTPYQVSVRAVNAAGPGAGSEPAAVTPVAVPGPLQDVSVTPGDASLVVAFVPGTDNGSAITGYQVSLDDGVTWQPLVVAPVSQGSSNLTGTVTDLVNTTSYSVRVRALNDQGAGAASDAFPVTPFTVPGTPEVTVSVGDKQIGLSFPAPVANGSPITGYQVSVDDGAWSDLTTTGSDPLAATLAGLVNGTTYQVSVRAVNVAGAGAASAAQSAVPRAVPGAPSQVQATAGDHSLVLAFLPSPADGTPVTGYEFSLDGGDSWNSLAVEGTDPLAATLSGLTNGTTYSVLLRATSAAGPSLASAAVSAMPIAVPGQPQVTVVGGDRILSLSFAPPTTNGSAITGYQVSTNGGTTWSPLTTAGTDPLLATVSGLTNGSTYSVLVRADNAVGTGPASVPVTVRLGMVPGLPRNVRAVPGDRVLTVMADAAQPGGPAPHHYQVSIDSGHTWTSVAANTAGGLVKRYEGLMDGTTYTVAVRFVDASGRYGQSPSLMVRLPVWFHDMVSAANRASEIAVPLNPAAYRGPLAMTRVFNRAYDGTLAIPASAAIGHQLQPKQAVTLTGLFAFDSSALTATGRQQLATLVRSLRYGHAIACEGYADYAGTATHEVSLSQQRAAAVCSTLRALGAHVTTQTVGYGGAHPVIVGGTATQRAANRRVVVRLLS